jgi:hypothetical protein
MQSGAYSFFGAGGTSTGMGWRYIFLANVAVVTASAGAAALVMGLGSGETVTTTLLPLLSSSFICSTDFCINEIMPQYTTSGFLRQQQTPAANFVQDNSALSASANYACYQGIHDILLSVQGRSCGPVLLEGYEHKRHEGHGR